MHDTKPLPEPYRSRIIHNAAVCRELFPDYFNRAMRLVWPRIANDRRGILSWPEHMHWLFAFPDGESPIATDNS